MRAWANPAIQNLRVQQSLREVFSIVVSKRKEHGRADFILSLANQPAIVMKFRHAATEAAGSCTVDNAESLVSEMYAANA